MKRLKNITIVLLFMGFQTNMKAQHQEIEIWNDGVPNAITSSNYAEKYEEAIGKMSKVSHPTLTVFVPENPNGTSVVICPGGGYAYLSIKKEGYDTAKWFNSIGITAFVLKYRLPSDEIMKDKSIGPLQDVQEAVRYIRRNAKKWNLDTDKIGILGYSAGGHLAASLSTKYDEVIYTLTDSVSAKPDFSLLIYPVLSMKDGITHKGSKNKLLGKEASDEMKNSFSTEDLVDAQTPLTFLVHALDDQGVPAENSIQYLLALQKHQVISEIHLYQNGGHGFGLGKEGTSRFWTKHCEDWLRTNQFIK